jgi:uncharacterized membrane protein SpoIIM required for sporulation
MKFAINFHGLFGLCAIVMMLLIVPLKHFDVAWWYLVLSTLVYAICVISLSLFRENTKLNDNTKFELFRFLMGCHIAYSILVLGFIPSFNNFWVELAVMIAGTAAGLAVPYLLIRKV